MCRFNRIVIFGDNFGVAQLLNFVPNEKIKGIVLSNIRPQYFEEVKAIAEQSKLPLFIQPKYNSSEYLQFSEEFKKMNFDLLLCTSYSLIIRKDILEHINFNAVNIHWALLPYNRGPNPIQWAIIKGENKTGITIHYMDEGLDSGDIIFQTEEEIKDTDTWLSVNERLEKKSAAFIQRNIDSILDGSNNRTKQNESIATKNERLTPESPLINFKSMTDRKIFNLIRAQVTPLKGAYIKKGHENIYFENYLSMPEIIELRKKYG